MLGNIGSIGTVRESKYFQGGYARQWIPHTIPWAAGSKYVNSAANDHNGLQIPAANDQNSTTVGFGMLQL
jgi:hypothetical protein